MSEYGINSTRINLGEIDREHLDRLIMDDENTPMTEEEWEEIADNILGRVNNFLEEIIPYEIEIVITRSREEDN
jgi:hypothetical protein